MALFRKFPEVSCEFSPLHPLLKYQEIIYSCVPGPGFPPQLLFPFIELKGGNGPGAPRGGSLSFAGPSWVLELYGPLFLFSLARGSLDHPGLQNFTGPSSPSCVLEL